ncbi:MAG: hypothetical protein Q8O72_01430 [Bacteroidales bacterium]|nr:hypothetical protein [Bacteroidales bacterium]
MKKADVVFALGIVALFLPFFLSESLMQFYLSFNHDHGLIMSFIKFALLATLGEVIGLRIKTGYFTKKGFGLVPRMIVWGVLGITIKMAFVIFATGTPAFMDYCGFDHAVTAFKGALTFDKVLVAFCISAAMNLIYAPVMMTIHKITDTHILQNGGTMMGFFKPIQVRKIFVNLNWDVQWNFVFKKTIPFFWIPAHTITFLLLPDFQVLFAALLGIALGTILAVADMTGNKIN